MVQIKFNISSLEEAESLIIKNIYPVVILHDAHLDISCSIIETSQKYSGLSPTTTYGKQINPSEDAIRTVSTTKWNDDELEIDFYGEIIPVEKFDMGTASNIIIKCKDGRVINYSAELRDLLTKANLIIPNADSETMPGFFKK